MITGGAGFIGQHLTERLLNVGQNLFIIDNFTPQVHGQLPDFRQIKRGDNVTVVRRPLDDIEALQDYIAQTDILIHLAAETGTGQSQYELTNYYNTNVLSTAKLLQAFAKNKNNRLKKVILSSSRSVYGEGGYINTKTGAEFFPSSRLMDDLLAGQWDFKDSSGSLLTARGAKETDPISVSSIYAATKFAQEQMIEVFCKSIAIKYYIFRFQNVYGPGQSLINPYTGILSIFSNLMRQGKPISIFEDGEETRDFVFVSDVVEFLVRAINEKTVASGVYNLGSGKSTSINTIADLLKKYYKPGSEIIHTKEFRVGDIRNNFSDNTKLIGAFGEFDFTSIDEGIQRFLNWVDTQPIFKSQISVANEELEKRNLFGRAK